MKRLIYFMTGLVFITILEIVIFLSLFLNKIEVSLPLILLISIYPINLVFTIALFSQVRQDQAKLSWLTCFALFPFISHLIFFIFGQRYKRRKSHPKYKQIELMKYESLEGSDDALLNQQSIFANRGAYKGDFKITGQGYKSFMELFEDIKNAKKFIHLQYYIVKRGEIWDELKHLLEQKASEGVEVRFIIDDFGQWTLPWYEINSLRERGIHVRLFGKVRFPFIGSENGYRNHRKIVIIDGNTVHTGGINIADEYANLSPKYGVWLDYNVKVTGKIVRSYSLLFLQDWKYLSDEKLNIEDYLLENEEGNNFGVLTEDSPEIIGSVIEQSLIKWIMNARKSIKICSPYFIPTKNILSALASAASSGVDVRIFIPGLPDKKVVLATSKYYARQLDEYNVKFYNTNDIFIHSKFGVIDDKYAYFGSANVDFRSFYSQFELLNLIHGESVKEFSELFDKYEQVSSRITYGKESFIKRYNDKILRFIFTLFSPVM